MINLNLQFFGGRGASSAASRYAAAMTGGGGKSKSYPVDISKIKDKSLQGIENKIRQLKHEEAYIFDKNDKLVAGASGGNSSVGIPNNWGNLDGATVTHGHPVGKYNFGGTLSMADANLMANTKWGEMRAAASGKGEYNYIMKRTSKSDNSGLKNRIAKDSKNMEKNIADTYKKSYNKAIASGKSESKARHESAQKAVGLMQSYWRKTLPQYGFVFVTPKKEYNYGR